MSNTFGGESQEARQGDNGNRIQGEDNVRVDVCKVDCYADRHKYQENVDPTVEKGGFEVVIESSPKRFLGLFLFS